MNPHPGIDAQAAAETGGTITDDSLRATLLAGLGGQSNGARLLVLIPDHTRSLPMPALFRLLVEILGAAKQLDFMVALGTHPPLSEAELCRLVGITAEERRSTYGKIGLLNHAWDQPGALRQVGTLSQDQVRVIAGDAWHPSLGGDVPVRINGAALDYDRVIIVGPTFPHEVAGFSGGEKYLFPGISGPEMIHVTHWLGALVGVVGTIGVKDTPVRRMIHAAACLVPTPVTLIGLVVEHDGLAGVFIGEPSAAWEAAAELSSQRHIQWSERPYQRILSWAPAMYDELWTAAKAMYKLEPATADGGEVIIYAPHLAEISRVHGRAIDEVGYHVLDYYLKQWDRFQHIPLGVLAHSTHVRGAGRFEDGVETPRVRVTLASRVSAEHCARLNLGYADPDAISPDEWKDREDEGILFVPRAGEILYRVRPR